MVCLSVCLLVTFVSPVKTAQLIEMLFGWLTWVDPRNHVLDGVEIPPTRMCNFGVVQPTHTFRAGRKINNYDSGTAATGGNAPTWLMSQ